MAWVFVARALLVEIPDQVLTYLLASKCYLLALVRGVIISLGFLLEEDPEWPCAVSFSLCNLPEILRRGRGGRRL